MPAISQTFCNMHVHLYMHVENIAKNVHASTRNTKFTDGCSLIDDNATVEGSNNRNAGSRTAKILIENGLEEEHIKAHRGLLVSMENVVAEGHGGQV